IRDSYTPDQVIGCGIQTRSFVQPGSLPGFFYFIMEAVNALDLAELIERALFTLPRSSPNSTITLVSPRRASSSVAFITKCSALRMLLTGNATDIESISGILSLNFTVTMTDGD
ncbi:hypothetical protein Q2347_25715, partial [Escherichia coli]|nr:hypothetical protein [Escherichia coli]